MVDTKQARWVYRVARNFCGCLFLRIGHFFCFAETNFCDYNLGQNKMEQQTPIPPKSRMKPREGQKRTIFPSLIWGGGGGV